MFLHDIVAPLTIDEAKATKTRLDPKCWKGKKIGNPKTKVKGGVRVNNCVPIEEDIGPDRNDPWEQGWRANPATAYNPYEQGTHEYKQWEEGQAERQAQPNHYDESMAEGKGLAKKVKIVKGPDAGKTGWIREIKHGAFKGAAKSYYIDLDDGGQANNIPGTALRLVKDPGVAETTGDPSFDSMMKRVTKAPTAKERNAERIRQKRERQADSRQRAAAVFGSSPADQLSIRKSQGVAEDSTLGELDTSTVQSYLDKGRQDVAKRDAEIEKIGSERAYFRSKPAKQKRTDAMNALRDKQNLRKDGLSMAHHKLRQRGEKGLWTDPNLPRDAKTGVTEAQTVGNIKFDNGVITQGGKKIGTAMQGLQHGYHPSIELTLNNGFNKWYEFDTENLMQTMANDINASLGSNTAVKKPGARPGIRPNIKRESQGVAEGLDPETYRSIARAIEGYKAQNGGDAPAGEDLFDLADDYNTDVDTVLDIINGKIKFNSMAEADKHSLIGKMQRGHELKKKVDSTYKDIGIAQRAGNHPEASKAFRKHERYSNLERPGTWTKVDEKGVAEAGRKQPRRPKFTLYPSYHAWRLELMRRGDDNIDHLDNDLVDSYRVLFAVDRNRQVVGMYYRTAETGTFVPPGQGFSDMIYYASTDPHWPYSEDDGKEDLREMGRAGVDDTDTVGFSVNSEAAYTAVMQRFGHLVDHDETSGIMYAPARVWPQIEMTAFDADGEGATRDDGIDESGDVEDFLARGGKITQVKPNKGPRYPGTSLGSKHIGTTRGGKASTISGKNANTRATVKPVVAVEADRNEMDTPEFQAAIAKMKKRHAQDDQNFNLDKARELGKKLAARGAAERKTKGVDEDSWHDGQNAWSSENNQWSNESVEDRRLNRLIEYRLAEMRRAGYDI